MNTKLTLKLDKSVIEKAKEYASIQQRSLSGIIESYLQSITGMKEEPDSKEIQISDFVKSMATGINIPSDLDFKAQYFDHLDEKYK